MSGTKDLGNPFVEWLLGELDERGWSREDLAREAGVKSNGITNVVNRKKNLGATQARVIAKGLGIKQRIVFAVARLIDDEEVGDVRQEKEMDEIQRMLSRIEDPKERERIRRIIRSIVREALR